MGINDGTPQLIMNQWFGYIKTVCENSKCEDCPFVGNTKYQTDIGTLSCETGMNIKPRSKDEQGTGKNSE